MSLFDGRSLQACQLKWTLEPDEYENGSPCWCVSTTDLGPDYREANFSHRKDAELFLRAVQSCGGTP